MKRGPWPGKALNLGAAKGHRYLYQIDFLQHDTAGMEREAAALMGKPGYEGVGFGVQAGAAAFAGRFTQARELTRRAAEAAGRTSGKEVAANYLARAALYDALVGNFGPARRQAQAALTLANGKETEGPSAMALALAGNSGEAGRLAGDLARRFTEDTVVQTEYLPMVQGCIWLGTGIGAANAGKAVDAMGGRHDTKCLRSMPLICAA